VPSTRVLGLLFRDQVLSQSDRGCGIFSGLPFFKFLAAFHSSKRPPVAFLREVVSLGLPPSTFFSPRNSTLLYSTSFSKLIAGGLCPSFRRVKGLNPFDLGRGCNRRHKMIVLASPLVPLLESPLIALKCRPSCVPRFPSLYSLFNHCCCFLYLLRQAASRAFPSLSSFPHWNFPPFRRHFKV